MSFVPLAPFAAVDFPPAEKPFPILEVFGYHRSLRTEEARRHFTSRKCPFMGATCEKFTQYGFGYCSVGYKADGDVDFNTYAVCDHRVDGAPLQFVLEDAFGADADHIKLVPEVVLSEPRMSFDYIAIDPRDNRFVGIETQAIDLRGGGVGPAWEALRDGDPKDWRRRFSQEAADKGRKDTVAYGVNMANIYKRLGLQVAEKGCLFDNMGTKLYVVAQHRPFQYMAKRLNITWKQPNEPWAIAFMTFEYTGNILPNGQMEMVHRETYRTSVGEYAAALIAPTNLISKAQLIQKVRAKGKLL